jgi:acetyl-CoA C-acetyltransferase
MFPTDVVIVAGARTPMARYTGIFSEVSAIDLGSHAAVAAIQRSGVDPNEIDHVIFGNVMQTSADAIYGAACGFEGRLEDGNTGGDRQSPVWVRH